MQMCQRLDFSTHYLKAPFVFDLSTQVQIQLGDQQSITNTRQALKTFYFDTSTSGTKKSTYRSATTIRCRHVT